MTSTRAAAAAAFLLAGAGCATASPGWLARVDQETITARELRQEFARHHYALEKILASDDDVRKYVDRLVDRRLFVQEGYRLGLQDAPDVKEAVARVRGQKMAELLLEDELDAKAVVREDEVKAAHERLGERLEVRQVVVRTREAADAVAAALAAGGDLEALARERSIADSAKRGGMLAVGWGLDEAYERTLFPLPDGKASPPFQSAAGWEVARVEKRTAVERPPLERVAGQIRQLLQKRRRQALEADLYASLWSRYEARVLPCAPDVGSLEPSAAAKDPTPCASWRGGGVTVAALAARVKLAELRAVSARWPELRQALVEDLVNRELLRLEAEARGYGARPEVVEPVKVQQDDLVESRLYRDYVVKDVRAGEEDARGYFDANRARFVEEARYDLAQVVVDTPELAREVEEKIRSRQPFAEIAAAYTKDKEARKAGGRVGPVAKGLLRDEFAPVAALGEGEVSAPIRARDGYHLVKVLAIVPERPRTFEESKEEARARALEERQRAEVDRWVKALRAAARIRISEAGIRAYVAEAREEARREREAAQAKGAAKLPPGHAPVASASPAGGEGRAEGTAAPAAAPGTVPPAGSSSLTPAGGADRTGGAPSPAAAAPAGTPTSP